MTNKFNYAIFENKEFFDLLMKLMKIKSFPFKLVAKIAQLIEEFKKHHLDFNSQHRILLEEYGEKDEKGIIKTNKETKEIIVEENKKVEFQKKYTQLRSTEFEIEKIPVNIKNIPDKEFNVIEYNHLKNLFDIRGQ